MFSLIPSPRQMCQITGVYTGCVMHKTAKERLHKLQEMQRPLKTTELIKSFAYQAFIKIGESKKLSSSISFSLLFTPSLLSATSPYLVICSWTITVVVIPILLGNHLYGANYLGVRLFVDMISNTSIMYILRNMNLYANDIFNTVDDLQRGIEEMLKLEKDKPYKELRKEVEGFCEMVRYTICEIRPNIETLQKQYEKSMKEKEGLLSKFTERLLQLCQNDLVIVPPKEDLIQFFTTRNKQFFTDKMNSHLPREKQLTQEATPKDRKAALDILEKARHVQPDVLQELKNMHDFLLLKEKIDELSKRLEDHSQELQSNQQALFQVMPLLNSLSENYTKLINGVKKESQKLFETTNPCSPAQIWEKVVTNSPSIQQKQQEISDLLSKAKETNINRHHVAREVGANITEISELGKRLENLEKSASLNKQNERNAYEALTKNKDLNQEVNNVENLFQKHSSVLRAFRKSQKNQQNVHTLDKGVKELKEETDTGLTSLRQAIEAALSRVKLDMERYETLCKMVSGSVEACFSFFKKTIEKSPVALYLLDSQGALIEDDILRQKVQNIGHNIETAKTLLAKMGNLFPKEQNKDSEQLEKEFHLSVEYWSDREELRNQIEEDFHSFQQETKPLLQAKEKILQAYDKKIENLHTIKKNSIQIYEKSKKDLLDKQEKEFQENQINPNWFHKTVEKAQKEHEKQIQKIEKKIETLQREKEKVNTLEVMKKRLERKSALCDFAEKTSATTVRLGLLYDKSVELQIINPLWKIGLESLDKIDQIEKYLPTMLNNMLSSSDKKKTSGIEQEFEASRNDRSFTTSQKRIEFAQDYSQLVRSLLSCTANLNQLRKESLEMLSQKELTFEEEDTIKSFDTRLKVINVQVQSLEKKLYEKIRERDTTFYHLYENTTNLVSTTLATTALISKWVPKEVKKMTLFRLLQG